MNRILYFISAIAVLTYFSIGCSKPSSPAKPVVPNATPAQVLSAEANIIIEPSYVSFSTTTQNLYTALVLLQNNPSTANLNTTRAAFITATAAYEQCETFNFGPTNINGFDPQVNTYPIDTFWVDTLVNGSTSFTQNNVTNLPGNFKGFHCIEFELYGGNGNKTIAQFTNRQYNYMDSLALNMLGIAQQLASVWNSSVSGNYNIQYANAGNGSTVYTDQKAAMQDLILGLYNYCDIDEQQKLKAPFSSNKPSSQESPFANNSMQDIYNNLVGARNCYLGQYGSNTGYGISSLVSPNNPSLDNKIKADMSLAITYVNAVQPNLTAAMINSPNSIQLALNYCDTIDLDFKIKLLPYINTIVP